MEEKNYSHIMMLFDPEDELGEFCHNLIEEQWPEDKIISKKDKEEILAEGRSGGLHIGFAVGYIIGQMFDIGNEETAALVADLKQRLLNKKALPYLPH